MEKLVIEITVEDGSGRRIGQVVHVNCPDDRSLADAISSGIIHAMNEINARLGMDR